MQRNALRDADVRTLIRIVREQRENGLGPEEAFAIAKKAVPDATPEAFKGWKAHVIEEAAKPGAAPVNKMNLVQRSHSLEAENAELRRKVADLGAKLEQASGSAELTEARAEIDRLSHLNERLNADLASLRKEHEAALELIDGKKHKK